jgi:hypothetical protein
MHQEPKNYILVDADGRKWNECGTASIHRGVHTKSGAERELAKSLKQALKEDSTHPAVKLYKTSHVVELPIDKEQRRRVLEQVENVRVN